ncbi:MAG: glycine reductase [Clostridia bacterium]|nr:glycine reductase [Clostridia bacterium]
MNSVVSAASYILVHTPDMVIHNGSTQTTERIVNPDSEYLKELPKHIRSYEEAVAYLPNQTYIGNMTPAELGAIAQPWYDKPMENAERYGKFGEIMPQEEFLLLMQICDVFELVHLEKSFVAETRVKLEAHPLMTEAILARIAEGVEQDEIEHFVNDEHAEGLYHNGKLVGYVKRAHDVDVNLSAHVIHENLVSKASNVVAVLHLIKNAGIAPEEIEYIMDCSEEACGDVNQRGGGNFAKSVAEIVGLSNATGSDMRGFCAGPAHTMVAAASLVKAGTYKHVLVSAGGCTAKLGMNGKDHVKKDMPIMEDVLGGFCILVRANDGIHPEIDNTIVGRHTVGTGSAPQAVITSLVSAPLARAGMKITDIDKYAAEMQNPDVTKPAGAGDVPQSNYKMIGALAVKNGDIQRAELATFADKYGMVGWAPTQGHIPSGAPYIGFAVDDIMEGRVEKAMIVGKGSLFLGRMTNLFDGVSFVIRKNSGATEAAAEGGVSKEEIRGLIADALRDFASSMLEK